MGNGVTGAQAGRAFATTALDQGTEGSGADALAAQRAARAKVLSACRDRCRLASACGALGQLAVSRLRTRTGSSLSLG